MVTFFLLNFFAYSKAAFIILSDFFLVITFIEWNSSSEIFSSNPTYKSSVFSLKITISTFSYFVFIFLIDFIGLIFAKRSYFFLSSTLIDLKPCPIGVVIGPLIAILFFSIDLKTSSGIKVFSFSKTLAPAFTSSNSTFEPKTFKTFFIESQISGPIPSPFIKVTFIITPILNFWHNLNSHPFLIFQFLFLKILP